jgi:hypothetical protein
LLKADASAASGYVSKVGGDTVVASGAAVKPLVLKGASSQTANLQEWQDSTGAVVASVSPTGNIAGSGLTLVKKQTIGTGVSSVTVTGAFSATYDNYKIVISGGVASTGSYLQLQLGASAASYSGGIVGYNDSTSVIVSGGMRNISSWIYAGWSGVNNIALDCTLINPFLAKYTTISGQYYTDQANSFNLAGRHEVASSYTAFTLTPVSGTLTGGTIYVYGYGTN